MAIFTFVDPRTCVIKSIGADNHTSFLEQVKKLVGTSDLGHCMPIHSPIGILCGNFHDDHGLERHFYGIILKGYAYPILGPSCFYAESGSSPQGLVDFNYKFIPGENLQWMMKDPTTMTFIRRPADHIPSDDPHAHMI